MSPKRLTTPIVNTNVNAGEAASARPGFFIAPEACKERAHKTPPASRPAAHEPGPGRREGAIRALSRRLRSDLDPADYFIPASHSEIALSSASLPVNIFW